MCEKLLVPSHENQAEVMAAKDTYLQDVVSKEVTFKIYSFRIQPKRSQSLKLPSPA